MYHVKFPDGFLGNCIKTTENGATYGENFTLPELNLSGDYWRMSLKYKFHGRRERRLRIVVCGVLKLVVSGHEERHPNWEQSDDVDIDPVDCEGRNLEVNLQPCNLKFFYILISI